MAIAFVGSGVPIATSGTSTTPSGSYSCGSGADRLLVAVITGVTNLGGGAIGCSAITYNGVSMLSGAIEKDSGSRGWAGIYYLAAPASGSNSLAVTLNAASRGVRVVVHEFTGVDQTTSKTTGTSNAAKVTANRTVAVTTSDDGAVVVSGAASEGDAGAVVGSGGVGNTNTGNTGGSSRYTDEEGGSGHEIKATAGSVSHTWTPTLTRDMAAVIMEFKPAASGITGSGAVTAGAATITATGEHEIPASGDVTTAAAIVASTAEREITASGALTTAPAALAGSGAVGSVVTGSAALATATVSVASTGKRSVTSSGAIATVAATIAGSAERSITALGAIVTEPANLAGSGSVAGAISGSGNINVPGVLIASTGERTVAASGAATIAPVDLGGSGAVSGAVSGTGDIDLSAVTVAATGKREITASGAVLTAVLVVNGSGAVGGEITGSGAINIGPVLVASAGKRTVTASGTVVLAPVAISSVGKRHVAASGSVTIGGVTISGAAKREIGATATVPVGVVQVSATTANLFDPRVTLIGSPAGAKSIIGTPAGAANITGTPAGVVSITGDGEVDPVNITEYYEGEPIDIVLLAKAPGGTSVIASPASQLIKVTISRTRGGASILEFTDKFTMTDLGTGAFSITLAAADIAALTEGQTYYYNIWSQLAAADPRLQKWGSLILGKSIAVA